MKTTHTLIVLLLLATTPLFASQKLVVSGIVKDQTSGKSLNGVNVFVEKQTLGTVTDDRGMFTLYLDKGSYELVISGIGYNELTTSLELNNDIEKEVRLSPKDDEKKRKTGWFRNKE